MCVFEVSYFVYEDNGSALKMMPTSLQNVNIGMTEAGNSLVAAQLYFRVLK